jgi:1-deoxy-D-xylulose-5-phosphate reductoisomerase
LVRCLLRGYNTRIVPRNVVILGSTGSIGTQTLEVLQELGSEFRVVGLAARSDADKLLSQIKRFAPPYAGLCDPQAARKLQGSLNGTTRLLSGPEMLQEMAALPEADLVVCAVVGAIGLLATAEALRRGTDVALANKEALVAGGSLLIDWAAASGARILPIDSEHSAIFQALRAGHPREVARVVLTASGGPFRTATKEQMARATREEALRHPTWSMGAKITIDSATLANKALELIEAKYLFALPEEKIEVLVHPQSIVHSIVEFCDGSMIAQLAPPDMRLPIRYALTHPRRLPIPNSSDARPSGVARIRQLTFEEPDLERFPALRLGREAARIGGTMEAVFNASNETAVIRFLDGKIPFLQIPRIIEQTMKAHFSMTILRPELEQILEADRWARDFASGLTT